VGFELQEIETGPSIEGLLDSADDVAVNAAPGDGDNVPSDSEDSDSDGEGSLYVDDDEGMDDFDAE
jgi:hypothetical protein